MRGDPIGRLQTGELGRPFRKRSGLVRKDQVDPSGALERIAALEEHTELGGPARSHDDRGRRGDAEGARAGGDDDRDHDK